VSAEGYVALDTGDAVLLDAIGAMVARLEPAGQVGIILDLEGKLNKLQVRDVHRYILSAGQAAEMVARLVDAAQHANSIDAGSNFAEEFAAAVAREQELRGLHRSNTKGGKDAD